LLVSRFFITGEIRKPFFGVQMTHFDVAVIGGGHAGIEACYASSKLGCKTILVTMNIDRIGEMSCNPSIGGQAKGQIVRELDIFGGIMPKAADFSAIQYRVLNRRKGPAVQALRAQCDKYLYKNFIIEFLKKQKNLDILQAEVIHFSKNNDGTFEFKCNDGTAFFCKSFVLTAGTFLNGTVHIGKNNFSSGRLSEPSSSTLTTLLIESGHKLIRLKTGTPVRLSGKSIDFSKMEIQNGETNYTPFSSTNDDILYNQKPCHITRTTSETKKIIEDNLHLSPLYGHNKSISGIGPRYCPSIEDKIVKFSQKETHQIFVEPESWSCSEFYPNGISTSLPIDVQKKILYSIPGFENAQVLRPAYAIEYDAFDPRDITPNMESRFIGGMFFAGQINGTSGYEEAAGQGLVAGVNAAKKAQESDPDFVPLRNESYIGVMLSDITSTGVDEPYRMFTSRAEFRLYIRDNNSAERLIHKSYDYNLIDNDFYIHHLDKIKQKDNLILELENTFVSPNTDNNLLLKQIDETPINKKTSLAQLLRRPGIDRLKLKAFFSRSIRADIWNRAEVEIKYSGFIDREKKEIERFSESSKIKIPSKLDFNTILGLTNEVKDKLNRLKPTTLSEASSIPGITPAAISILLLYIKRVKNENR